MKPRIGMSSGVQEKSKLIIDLILYNSSEDYWFNFIHICMFVYWNPDSSNNKNYV